MVCILQINSKRNEMLSVSIFYYARNIHINTIKNKIHGDKIFINLVCINENSILRD